MARKKSHRKHEVKAELSNFHLAKARSALTLRIVARGVKVGELLVGRGSLYWRGRHRQHSKRLNWSRFTKMMNDLAYGEDSG
jgi:hypothetical protein